MNSLAVGLVLLCALLILALTILERRRNLRRLRPIKAFEELRRTIDLSVEDGSRMQVSLGRGGLLGPQSAAALAGLSLLRQVAETASDSDLPPIATSGEATLALLSQDTLRSAYQRLAIGEQYHNGLGAVTGLTPFSYGAGTMPLVLDKQVSASALIGNFGLEAGLIISASQQRQGFALGGSDSLSAQALLFASADQPLIGEELYATGAYTGAGASHEASLYAQDMLRWIIVVVILVVAIGSLFGLGL
jgi:hypothetical protein